MIQHRRIALLLGQEAGFHRQVLLGIRAYAGYAKQWYFHSTAPTRATLRPLREWNPHGIIAHLDYEDDEKTASEILALGKPIVAVSSGWEQWQVPTVDVDHAAVGRLAAEHFLARGYRHFACFGYRRAYFALRRDAGFRQAVQEAGYEPILHHIPYVPRLHAKSWRSVSVRVRKRLKELPKPLAVLADNDTAAHALADVCRNIGLRVPDDVAILGVGDDELECRLAYLPLSSMAIPSERIGFEAAAMLDRLLSMKRKSNQTLYLPPVRVVVRQSTSAFSVDEPIVTAALHFIRNHFLEPLRVGSIADALVVRRRALEQKFRESLGHSVLHEIHCVRVERAKGLLLTDPDAPMADVARQSGFSTPYRMAMVFRKITGMSPGEYRRRNRLRG